MLGDNAEDDGGVVTAGSFFVLSTPSARGTAGGGDDVEDSGVRFGLSPAGLADSGVRLPGFSSFPSLRSGDATTTGFRAEGDLMGVTGFTSLGGVVVPSVSALFALTAFLGTALLALAVPDAAAEGLVFVSAVGAVATVPGGEADMRLTIAWLLRDKEI